MLFGGMAHRRADHVAKQVDELGEAIEAVEDQLREAPRPAPPSAPPIPGMPLPTGYGLQVRGPDDENIVLPVCLPPGFELASMVLCPEFLPRDAAAARVVGDRPRPPSRSRRRLAAAPVAEPVGRRRGACASASAARSSTSSAARPGLQRGRDVRRRGRGRRRRAPARASGVETHHLA